MHRSLLFAAAGLVLASCATPADRITAALESRGIKPSQARCMGDRLADRLSTGQLHRLNELAKLESARVGNLSLNQLLDQLNRGGDPKLVSEVVRAGLRCVL